MAPSRHDKQTAGCISPFHWLMSLAMDSAALCDMWGENGIDGSHLAVLSEDIAFVRHFVIPCLPPPSEPIGMLLVLATLVKNYLK